jgi:hypothetical protein
MGKASSESRRAIEEDERPEAYLAHSLRLKKRLRSTKLLERSLEEVRRRAVTGGFPGETSCLTMAWAVMDLVLPGLCGLRLTLLDGHPIATIVAVRAVPDAAHASPIVPVLQSRRRQNFTADPGCDRLPISGTGPSNTER